MVQSSSPIIPQWTLRQTLRQALQPRMALRSLLASAIIWLLMASAMPSYAGLIFRGRLDSFFAVGLAIVLISEIVSTVITAFFSSDHATQVVPQSPTAVIQGLVAASVVDAMPAETPPDERFAVVFLVIALSSVLSGVFAALLGVARAGNLIRYIPYPIIGGFMAGLGWLIFNAGFLVLVDIRLSVEALPLLLTGENVARWLPALAFALCILGLRTRIRSALVIPGVIIAALSLFTIWATVLVDDMESITAAGWLLPNVSNALRWTLPDLSAIAKISPAVIAGSAGDVLSLIVVYMLNLFLRASAQEVIVKRDMNLSRECIVNGVANIASAFSGGGIVAYHAPISSSLLHTMRVNGRLAGIILAVMFTLTLLLGSAIFALIPRFIPAGLLMFFGLQFMKEWLLESWSKLPRQDYFIVAIIALATALLGLLPGIALGLVTAIAAFALEYSRMDVIKQEHTGRFFHSNLDRSFAQNQLLQQEGDKILILRLQGFIFFGTAYRIFEHVKARVSRGDSRIQFLILDFQPVRGMDVSTIYDFQKLEKLTGAHDIDLLVANTLPHLQKLMIDSEITVSRPDKPAIFDDLDHALEWCENALLEAHDLQAVARIPVMQQLAERAKFGRHELDKLPEYLERIETKAGDTIFKQGDEPDAMYFIESGRVDVLLHGKGQREIRLRSMTAGVVIGEVGFYLGEARSASIVATEAGVLQRLSHESLRRMGSEDPQTATAVHVLIASILSERLSTTNQLVRELVD